MDIKRTNGSFFYFKLDDDDFKKYGMDTCKRFLNSLKKEIPAGKWYWIAKIKCFSINNDYMETLNKLTVKYFDAAGQRELF